MQSWVAHPPQGDVYLRAYAQATLDDFAQAGPTYEFVRLWLSVHHHVSSSHAITQLQRGKQRQFLEAFPQEYPREFVDPKMWRKADESIFSDTEDAFSRYGQFVIDVWSRPLQSNKSERYKSLKAFAVLARELGRLSSFTVLDIGCSQNAGLNHMASGIGFESPTVIHPGSHDRQPNLDYTAAFSRVLQTELPLDLGVGIDLTGPEDSHPWAMACSHYPSELLNEERVGLFRALVMADYPNVGFVRGDATDFDHSALERAYPGRDQFDIVFLSTMLYQLDDEERAAATAFAESKARQFVVAQDFAIPDPDNPEALVIRDNWHGQRDTYNLLYKDMHASHRRWQTGFTWEDGRCRVMTPGLGRIAVGGLTTSVESALCYFIQPDD
ncbi:MAG TPA: class I SAM-dependent methyltransferase [Candidatus Saccharimonadales bacterium]|nr:class I SAM-dependent methyltransferase [Candidatus Saccharimonadales bacterium]